MVGRGDALSASLDEEDVTLVYHEPDILARGNLARDLARDLAGDLVRGRTDIIVRYNLISSFYFIIDE